MQWMRFGSTSSVLRSSNKVEFIRKKVYRFSLSFDTDLGSNVGSLGYFNANRLSGHFLNFHRCRWKGRVVHLLVHNRLTQQQVALLSKGPNEGDQDSWSWTAADALPNSNLRKKAHHFDPAAVRPSHEQNTLHCNQSTRTTKTQFQSEWIKRRLGFVRHQHHHVFYQPPRTARKYPPTPRNFGFSP